MANTKAKWTDAFRLDAWQNLLTGLGTLWDKGRWTVPRSTSFLDAETLESLFISDPWARRIVEDPVDAAMRQGFEIAASGIWIPVRTGWMWYEPDPEEVKRQAIDIEQELIRLGAAEILKKLFIFGRLWGREAVLIGADDGQPLDQPLVVDAIKAVHYLELVDRRDFFPSTYQSDPMLPGYGDPETWRINRASGTARSSQSTVVHSSRLLMAGGVVTSRSKRIENEWCDASVLQAPIYQLQRFNSDDMAVSSMMTDSSQAVLKIRDFAKILAGKDKDTLRTRMDIIDRGRSVSRVMPIDAEYEDFSYVDRTFAGVHQIMERRQQLLAGAVGWPVVILFGREPAGLSATGEADIRAWYDVIQADRGTVYQPLIERLVRLVASSVGEPYPASWGITWPSLWQESPSEHAARQKMVAETDAVYLAQGVLEPDEVATARFGSDEWSDRSPQLDHEIRGALREQDLVRARGKKVEENEPQIDWEEEGAIDV